MNITQEVKQYISGFFDGDGSISIEKQKETNYTLRIKFTQSNLNLIEKIQSFYPFLKYDGGLRNGTTNHKCEFQLRAAGHQIEPLVNDLYKYSILKYEQICEAKKMFKYIGIPKTNSYKEEIYNNLKQLKLKSTDKPYSRLCIPYIAGLFDAEGSIGIYKNTLRVKITQKSDTVILEKIAKIYNNVNKIDNYAISFYGKNALPFLEDILPYCIYKTPQIKAAIKYIETIDSQLSEEILDIRNICIQTIRNEKTIDNNNTLFKNQETHKEYLRSCFLKFKELTYNDVLLHCKQKEIEKTECNPLYEERIFNLQTKEEWLNLNISPQLEFCETTHQNNIYNYYRKKVSSLPVTGIVGRSIRILVKDNITNKYIGIMCLSSDVYNLGERDNYIKETTKLDWYNRDVKNEILKNILNLSCCVPLQPFGYNTNGGKLLASLAFSKEVFDYYLQKYNEPLLAIVTTSINGKSIQYDRLKCLKLIGFTKGYGSVHFPSELFQICKEYNDDWKVIQVNNRIDRFNFLKLLLSHLELSQDILLHNRKRGIYFGYLFSTKFNKDYNIGKLLTTNEIHQGWFNRWCKNRIQNLLNEDRFKYTTDLYTLKTFENIKYNSFKLPKIVDKKITDGIIKEILEFKTKPITQNEVVDIINNKYNMCLTKNDISKIYTGIIRPEYEDKEYLNLIDIKNTKTKITDRQHTFILQNKNCIYSEIASKFFEIFNQKISISTISKIISINNNKSEQNDVSDKEYNNDEKLKKLSDVQLLIIMKMKNEDKTTQEVSDFIKDNYNLYINRNVISRLWNNQIHLPPYLCESIEYQSMISNIKKRQVKLTKFTKDEINFLLNSNESLSKCAELFKAKFNKSVTRAYISKLKNKK